MHHYGRNAEAPSSSFQPMRHVCNRVVLPAHSSARPTERVTVEHSRAPNRGRQEYGEVVGNGWCKLTVALRRGQTRVMRNGVLLHEGAVFPGMVRLSEPGDVIQGEVFTAMEAVTVSLPVSRISDRLHCAHPTGRVRPILEPNTQTEQLGRLLLDLLRIDRQYHGLFGEGIIDALLAITLDHGGRGPTESRATGAFEGSELRQILDFAEDHIGQPLGLTEWAAAFDLSAHEFARRFRLATSSSPYSYFLRRRVERAKERMTSTDETLVKIALDVGFCSQSHFTEAFRRVVGVSPGRWRRERI
jgi:AraC family transcriptional regulator